MLQEIKMIPCKKSEIKMILGTMKGQKIELAIFFNL
jgi:hypothetical protein